MLTFRGGALGALLLTLTGLFAVGSLAAPGASAHNDPDAHESEPPHGIVIDAGVTLTPEGVLRVEQTVTVPEGERFQMTVPLRIPAGENVERFFTITDIAASGPGTAETADELFTIEANPGESEFAYSVHHAVSEAPGTQLFEWTGVMGTDIAAVSLELMSPSYEMGIVECTLGAPGKTRECADVFIQVDGALYLEQRDLKKGERINLSLQIPPGTVPTNADYRATDTTPFALTGPALAAFGVLLAALAAWSAYLWRIRRHTERAGTDTLNPLVDADGHKQFASPGGIEPGVAGVLLDERIDATDIAATVIDLAVRRYVAITPISDSDWRITRVNPADAAMRDYERQVYTALLPEGTDAVTVSALAAPDRLHAAPIRAALRTEMSERGLFTGRAQRMLPMWLGIGLIAVGIGTTIALALTAGHALVGVAVALGGVAAVAAPRFLPVRTAQGRELTKQLHAMRRGLDALDRDQIPAADAELIFSRVLPFTVVAGRADHWVRTFTDLPPSADGTPGLYWYGGLESDPNMRRFATQFPYFITAVERLFH